MNKLFINHKTTFVSTIILCIALIVGGTFNVWSIRCTNSIADSVVLLSEKMNLKTGVQNDVEVKAMIDKQNDLLKVNIEQILSTQTTTNIILGILALVFTALSLYGAHKNDVKRKELDDAIASINETKDKVVEEAKAKMQEIVNEGAKRQNLFDQLARIDRLDLPDKKVPAYTNFIKQHSDLDGVNLSYVYCMRGNANQAMSKNDAAMADYKQALKIDSKSSLAYCCIGNLFITKGKFEESIEPFKKALDLEPENASIMFSIANSYSKIKQFKEAGNYYQLATNADPDYCFVYYNKGIDLLNQAKQYDNTDKEKAEQLHQEALAQFNACLQRNPSYFPAKISMVSIFRDKDPLRAKKELSDTLSFKLDKDLVMAIIQRSIVLMLHGDYPQAKTGFEFSLIFDPTISKRWLMQLNAP